MTPTIDPEVARVRAGIAWLDTNIPDWLGRINLKRFNIWHDCDCVLGQLDGSYSDAVKARRMGDTASRAALGFSGWPDFSIDLDSAWRSEISRLRSERKTS